MPAAFQVHNVTHGSSCGQPTVENPWGDLYSPYTPTESPCSFILHCPRGLRKRTSSGCAASKTATLFAASIYKARHNPRRVLRGQAALGLSRLNFPRQNNAPRQGAEAGSAGNDVRLVVSSRRVSQYHDTTTRAAGQIRAISVTEHRH